MKILLSTWNGKLALLNLEIFQLKLSIFKLNKKDHIDQKIQFYKNYIRSYRFR